MNQSNIICLFQDRVLYEKDLNDIKFSWFIEHCLICKADDKNKECKYYIPINKKHNNINENL